MNTATHQNATYSAEVSADQARKAEPTNGAPPYSDSEPAPDREEADREIVHQITPDDVIKAPGNPRLPNSEANPAQLKDDDDDNDELQAMQSQDGFEVQFLW